VPIAPLHCKELLPAIVTRGFLISRFLGLLLFLIPRLIPLLSHNPEHKASNRKRRQLLTTKMSFIRRLLAFLTCCQLGLQLEQSADQPTSHSSQAVPSRGMFHNVGTVIIVGGTFIMQSSKPCLLLVIYKYSTLTSADLGTPSPPHEAVGTNTSGPGPEA